MIKSYTVISHVDHVDRRLVSMKIYAFSTKEAVEKSVRGYHRTFGWTYEIVETTPEIEEQVKQFRISEEERFKKIVKILSVLVFTQNQFLGHWRKQNVILNLNTRR